MNLYIDYGGTHFRYQINNEAIQTLKSENTHLVEFLDKMIPQYGIKKIGISFAGQVCNGKIISAPNIALEHMEIKNYIQSQYQVQLEIQNDLKCATLFESKNYSTYKNIAVVYIGTGVGCGVMINHQLIAGLNNFAGEVGHIPFKETPFVCGCGRNDCVELSLGGKALKNWGNYYGIEEALCNLQTLKTTFSNHRIYENFQKGLEHLFFTLLNVYDPEIFIFGGGIMQNNPQLVENLEECYGKSAFYAVRKPPKIVLSSSTNGSLEGAKILLQHKGNIYE